MLFLLIILPSQILKLQEYELELNLKLLLSKVDNLDQMVIEGLLNLSTKDMRYISK